MSPWIRWLLCVDIRVCMSICTYVSLGRASDAPAEQVAEFTAAKTRALICPYMP